MIKPPTYGSLFYRIQLTALLLLCVAVGLQAQWEAVYFDNVDFPDLETVAFTNRSNGLAAGANGVVLRTDNSGLNWDTILLETNNLKFVDLQFTSSTRVFAIGRDASSVGCVANDKGLIARSGNFGATWQLTYTDTSLHAVHFPNPDDGFAVGNCGAIYKTTDGGNSWEWLNTSIDKDLTTVFFIDDQKGFVAGQNNTFWTTTDGGDNWTDIDADLPGVEDYSEVVFPTADIGYVLSSGQLHKSIDGGNIWTATAYPSNGSYFAMSFVNENTGYLIESNKVAKTTDGGDNWAIQESGPPSIAGDFGQPGMPLFDAFFLNENDGFLVGNGKFFKTNSGGESLPSTQFLAGKVLHDIDDNCNLDGNETDLRNWIIRFYDPNNLTTNYTTTDENGNYFIALETGDYEVSLALPNDNWSSCQATYNANLSAPYDTLVLNMLAQDVVACPMLETDVSTSMLTHCANNTYTVRYYNSGTATATAPYVEVTLDEDLTMISSNWSGVSGNTYTFDLPDIAAGETGTFSFVAFLECDPIEGQTHSVTAHIYTDDFCFPPAGSWNGASLEVEANCIGDSVAFTIRNVGSGDMDVPQGFVIIEDHVLFFDGGVL